MDCGAPKRRSSRELYSNETSKARRLASQLQNAVDLESDSDEDVDNEPDVLESVPASAAAAAPSASAAAAAASASGAALYPQPAAAAAAAEQPAQEKQQEAAAASPFQAAVSAAQASGAAASVDPLDVKLEREDQKMYRRIMGGNGNEVDNHALIKGLTDYEAIHRNHGADQASSFWEGAQSAHDADSRSFLDGVRMASVHYQKSLQCGHAFATGAQEFYSLVMQHGLEAGEAFLRGMQHAREAARI